MKLNIILYYENLKRIIFHVKSDALILSENKKDI